MSDEATTQLPKVELATKDWALSELRDTEGRIERAFHDQTKFLTSELSKIDAKIDGQTRWLVGLMITMTIAILVAVLFK